VDNGQIARAFAEVADILEIQEQNPFRIRAYRNAAHTVEGQSVPLERLVAEGRPLTALQGIGKDMAAYIVEMIETGSFSLRDKLAAQIPRTLVEVMRLPGVGPKKARKLWDDLAISTVEELEVAAKEGRVAAVAGFGEKSQQKILAGIEEYRQHAGRYLLPEAERRIAPLLDVLSSAPGVVRLEVAGSLRRRRETVADVDLLALASPTGPVMERFLGHASVEKILMSGETRSTVVLAGGLQVDLRAVPPDCYGAALLYFTGSKEHNVKLRRRAIERGLHVSEYGVFAGAPGQGEAIAGREEAEVYAALGLSYIPPELREDRGEIEAAAAAGLPRLIAREDLRGDVHMHSTWSDGRETLETMVAACVERGYEYMAITDHSKALAMTNGLDARRLRLQWLEVAEVAARHPEIHLLRGMEVDILADGTLDLEDEMLFGLDIVLVSLHSRFDLPRAEQTERVLKALEHPAVQVFAHPTGRLLNRRKPVDMEVDTVLRRAAELGVAVELNCNPDRLDLKDTHLMRARELGCKIVINTDAHRPHHLDLATYGIEQARRAWLSPEHVINTLPYEQFRQALRPRPGAPA
jgi:DNA polymerase (family 10)